MSGIICKAQQTIPNGGFELFSEYEGGVLSGNIVTYELPDGGWTENVIINNLGRQYTGVGYFYKYDSADANGYALELKRGTATSQVPKNNGFIRFECSNVPSKITGKYKFSGSSIAGVTDTLRIAAYFKSVSDTLILFDEHTGNIPDDAIILDIIDSNNTFSDFELDMSSFQGQSVDYLSIQLIMKTGNIITNPGQATAVIDDLELDYTLSTIDILNNISINIYPNPFSNNFTIENAPIESEINLYNSTGKLIYHTKLNNSKTVQTSQLRNGLYYMVISKDNRMIYSEKIIKK